MQTKGVCIQYIQKTTWNYFDNYIIVHLIFSIQNKRGSLSFVEYLILLNMNFSSTFCHSYLKNKKYILANDVMNKYFKQNSILLRFIQLSRISLFISPPLFNHIYILEIMFAQLHFLFQYTRTETKPFRDIRKHLSLLSIRMAIH